MKRSIIQSKPLCVLAATLFWLAIWTALSLLVGRPLLFPPPHTVLIRLAQLSITADFWRSIGLSLLRVTVGFLLGTAAGILLAVLSCAAKGADLLIRPLITVIRSTPVASFIILALVFIGAPGVPVFITMLMVIPILYENVCLGIRSRSRELLEVAVMYRFSRIRRLKVLDLPTVFPHAMAGCTNAMGLAWKAGIAAEVLCTPRHSIGRHVYESKLYLAYTDLFAWTLATVLLSLLLETVLKRFFRDRISHRNKREVTPHVL